MLSLLPITSDNSDSDSEYETSSDTDSIFDLIDEIAEYESLLPQTEYKHHEYYIGTYTHMYDTLLLTNHIRISTFYKYDYTLIYKYMYYYSITRPLPNHEIDIIQLVILPDETYTVVVKTHWLRIIQRTWKKIYKQRELYVLCLKKTILSRVHTVRYKTQISKYPGLHGMLIPYNHKL